jgi:hypothetical protein
LQHFGLASLANLPPLTLPEAGTGDVHETILKG